MSEWYLFFQTWPRATKMSEALCIGGVERLRVEDSTLVVERAAGYGGWRPVDAQTMATPLAVQWAINAHVAAACERGCSMLFAPRAVLDRLGRFADFRWTDGWLTEFACSYPAASIADAAAFECLLQLPACARLRSVFVYPRDPEVLREFLDRLTDWPLERFGFDISWGISAEELSGLLEHPALCSVRELALRWHSPDPESDALFIPGPLFEHLLEVLLAAPLLHRLECRDFSQLQVWPWHRQQLLDAFASAPGRTLAPRAGSK